MAALAVGLLLVLAGCETHPAPATAKEAAVDGVRIQAAITAGVLPDLRYASLDTHAHFADIVLGGTRARRRRSR
ncbi:MAG: hypothetical protein ACREI8_03020 [Myxococcota bacterium]